MRVVSCSVAAEVAFKTPDNASLESQYRDADCEPLRFPASGSVDETDAKLAELLALWPRLSSVDREPILSLVRSLADRNHHP